MPSLIGNRPNQVSTNGDLGTLAFQDSNAVNLTGGTAVLSSVVSDSLTADSINLRIDHDLSNIAPSLNLDFANSKTLDPRITFTRASTATFYDGVTTAKAEENLVTYSQEFDNAAWLKLNATVTANSTAAPDGTTTAETLTDNATNSFHTFYRNITVSAGEHTLSIFMKAGTTNFGALSANWNAQAIGYGAVVDLTSGTVTTTLSNGGGSGTNSVQSVGNGWYRISITVNISVGSNCYFLCSTSNSGTPATSSSSVPTYVGSGGTILAWGAQVEQRSAVSAYTPTTTALITNYIPVLRTAASGVARFEHNPITGESLGLEIEESRTNLSIYSDDFSNAAWTKTASTITSNTIVAPDGTLTGDKLVDTAATSTHFISQTPTTTAAAHTFSVYAKAGELGYLALYSPTTTTGAVFDLLTGVSTVNVVTAPTSKTITPVGNGWYRCSITVTATAAPNTFSLYLNNINSASSSYLGNGFNGIYIWGAQLEAGAFATSYIPTVASTVTRAADAASITGTNFSNWYNASEGTMYADVVPNASLSNRISLDFNAGGGSSNYIALFAQRSSSLGILAFVHANATSQVDISTQTNADGKTVFAYKTNDFAMTRNGAAAFADTSGLVPQGIDRVFIGDDYNAGNAINGTIKKIQYFPRRLPNAELVEMTT